GSCRRCAGLAFGAFRCGSVWRWLFVCVRGARGVAWVCWPLRLRAVSVLPTQVGVAACTVGGQLAGRMVADLAAGCFSSGGRLRRVWVGWLVGCCFRAASCPPTQVGGCCLHCGRPACWANGGRFGSGLF